MFVDELTITAQAGKGGDGVVRWRQEKFVALGGPAGGNGGKGGDVYMRAVRDLNLLSKYTGSNEFEAENGEPGEKKSRQGKDGADRYIDVPVGATVTDRERKRSFTFMEVGEIHKILKGGAGGRGNESYKSSTNRSPQKATKGKEGEYGVFVIELSLIVDAGLIGLPNAGKSTLLNALTNTRSKVGAYPFTTLEPHLGSLYGFTIADIPGLVEGASYGKGLGHKFLRHVERTKMLLHVVSLENEDPISAYETVRSELKRFSESLLTKEEWIILDKSDLCVISKSKEIQQKFTQKYQKTVAFVSAKTGEGIKDLSDKLVKHLREKTQKPE